MYLFDSIDAKKSFHIEIHKEIIFNKINYNLHKFIN